jgi:hypothetical protein
MVYGYRMIGEAVTEDGIPVDLPSGARYFVLTLNEATYLRDRIERYLTDNHFINVSDIQEIDRMITLELLIHRWTMWISKGRNYYDEDINIKQHSDMVQDASREVRQLKKGLGLDKATRDRTRGDDSIAALWEHLQRRAQEFGYMRNDQYVAVITAFQRIKALVQFHDNCDDLERRENACEITDILEVVREELAKFDAIDEGFRHNTQRMWIRSQ